MLTSFFLTATAAITLSLYLLSLHYLSLHYIIYHDITLHHITLHYITLHYIVYHNITYLLSLHYHYIYYLYLLYLFVRKRVIQVVRGFVKIGSVRSKEFRLCFLDTTENFVRSVKQPSTNGSTFFE